MKISVEEFVCRSSVEEPKIATYGEFKLISNGEGGNRHIRAMRDDAEVFYMWIDIHCDKACFIHSVRTDGFPELKEMLNKTCSRKSGYFWDYNTWNDVTKLFDEILNRVR